MMKKSFIIGICKSFVAFKSSGHVRETTMILPRQARVANTQNKNMQNSNLSHNVFVLKLSPLLRSLMFDV
jgi:hypothetical protein